MIPIGDGNRTESGARQTPMDIETDMIPIGDGNTMGMDSLAKLLN